STRASRHMPRPGWSRPVLHPGLRAVAIPAVGEDSDHRTIEISACGDAERGGNVRTCRAPDEQALFADKPLDHRESVGVGHTLGTVDHVTMQVLGRLASTDALHGVRAVGTDATGLDPVGEAGTERVGE